MDKDGNSYLSEEWTFFDGTFKRCPGFVTLGAEMFHPLADRIIKLASMETDKEDTASIELFLETLIVFFNNTLAIQSTNSIQVVFFATSSAQIGWAQRANLDLPFKIAQSLAHFTLKKQ